MHILIAVLGAAAAAFWAFTYFTRAAQEGRDAFNDVRGMIRGGKWSRKVGQRVIENLTDPREAAAVVLCQIAVYDGPITDRQKAAILGEMRGAFHADEETAEGFYAFARMGLGEINDAANSLKKIVRPIADACSEDEKRQFVEMLARIAQIEGPVSDIQRRLIDGAKLILLPPR